ncbi:MAG: hypothetical protein COY46_04550 [Chloroflexi bacterium CG_4_10_14_0_8_um_filter_46_9]|nr:MAG: hypothetical protein AUK39_01605 [Dehalococcoidia bacterium CG2_30_46_19]PIZ26569.1 MAG: hypothetical protein COY46_04550 [Chloroflexi bacterium CG_4_10_14_0_8_um_filter_46_9]
MKVVALGGAGHIGACGVRELTKRAPDIEVVIADKNVEAANKLATEVGGKTSVKMVDASEHKSLVDVMKGADVVLSTLGPFHVFGEKVVKAAIETKTNLVDICDDWDATQSCLNLNSEARKAGVTIIIGLGATPGITNVMARYGANKLDRVDEVHTSWAWSGVDPTQGPAIVDHYFHAVTGKVLTYQDSKWVEIKANSGPEIIEFVPPIGRFQVCHVGHPEPITIPRYIKGVKMVCNKGGIWPDMLAEAAKFFVTAGLSSLKEVTIGGISMSARSIVTSLFLDMAELAAPEDIEAILKEVAPYGEFGLTGVVLRTAVKGERQGKPMRYVYGCGAAADLITSLPAVLGVLMFPQGQIKGKGVFAPEGIVDPKIFFQELIKDIPVEETKAEPISL